ncbi:ABC transporter permease subunit [Tropheryma whipplei]|uniref:ABC transporter permease subunit n=1 Tax=Tropheryma whipplei TaxID=2039 RepID=UPI0004B164FC|nr:sugar ABC transporter permease [Tropheryma whipplei]
MKIKLFSSRNFGILVAAVAVALFFQVASGGRMLTSDNVLNIVNGNSHIFILSIGMVLVIVSGNIDLSVGSVAAFVGIVVAVATDSFHLSAWQAIILGLLIGLVVGCWQAFWVAFVGIPAFIATLAGMLTFRGLNQLVGNSRSVPVPDDFTYFGAGYLPDIFTNTAFNVPTVILGFVVFLLLVIMQILRRRNRKLLGIQQENIPVFLLRIAIYGLAVAYLTYLFATGHPGTSFPIPGLIFVVIAFIYVFISERTILGRHIYAVGGNRNAAILSGVSVKRVNFFVMANMSILASIAGMMFVGRSGGSGPSDGVGWELDAIAAVFVGGAAVSGGVGTVIGACLGGVVVTLLSNGLLIMGISADIAAIIKGLVLLAAVSFDVVSKNREKPSIIRLFVRRSGLSRDKAGGRG